MEENACKLKWAHKPNPARQYLLAASAALAFNKYAYRTFRRFIAKYSDSRRLDASFSSYERNMTNLEARLVLKQLVKYSRTLNLRSSNAEIYRQYFKEIFKLIDISQKATPAYLYFPILTENAAILQRELALRSIEVKSKEGMYFDALYKHPRFDKCRHMGSNAEKTEEEYLLFPTGYLRDETEWICKETLGILRSQRNHSGPGVGIAWR